MKTNPAVIAELIARMSDGTFSERDAFDTLRRCMTDGEIRVHIATAGWLFVRQLQKERKPN